MILHGNQRGGAKDLALHLLKTENEHVEIHELRGFVSDNLVSAFNEIHAVSRGTKARQFLFSLSLNPPPSENVPTEAFEDAKWVGIKTKEVRSKLTDQASLPTVEEARAQIAESMTERLENLQSQQDSAIKTRLADIEQRRDQMVRKHEAARKKLRAKQEERWKTETLLRQKHFSKGLRGFLDRFTGLHRRIREQNELDMLQALQRDQQERDTLIFRQLEERRTLQTRIERLRNLAGQRKNLLSLDREQYLEIKTKQREVASFPRRTGSQRSIGGPKRQR